MDVYSLPPIILLIFWVFSKKLFTSVSTLGMSILSNKLSIVFQDLRLFEQLTAKENILLKNKLQNHKTLKQINEMAQKPRADPHPTEVWIPVQSEDFGNYHEGCRQGENGTISCPINGKLVGQYSLS